MFHNYSGGTQERACIILVKRCEVVEKIKDRLTKTKSMTVSCNLNKRGCTAMSTVRDTKITKAHQQAYGLKDWSLQPYDSPKKARHVDLGVLHMWSFF